MRMRFLASILATAALAWAAPASADTIRFNPEGTGNATATNSTLFDMAPGNTLVDYATNGGSIAAAPVVGTKFTLRYQANLSVIKNDDNIVFSNGEAAFGSNDFFTFTAIVDLVLVSNGAGGFVGVLDPAGANNVFEMRKNTVVASDLTGVCFVCGTTILTGKATNVTQNPSLDFSTIGNLDGNGTDNYPGTDTVKIGGSTALTLEVTSFLAGYFPDLPATGGVLITIASANSSLIAPYDQTNPSQCIHATSIVAGVCTGALAKNGVSSVGAINGMSGPNLMVQSDANMSFKIVDVSVPEPATMTLFGLGLLGAAVLRRRQQKSQQ